MGKRFSYKRLTIPEENKTLLVSSYGNIVLESLKTRNEFYAELRWLEWIFLGGYLPSLSINYVAMSKDMEKRFPQLYYIKMKISYDLGFIAIGVTMAT